MRGGHHHGGNKKKKIPLPLFRARCAIYIPRPIFHIFVGVEKKRREKQDYFVYQPSSHTYMGLRNRS